MLTHIGMRIWCFRSAEQTQSHDITPCGKPVLGVIEDGNSISRLRQVCPFVAAYLELGHVPARVVVGWSLDDAELTLVRCLGVDNIDWELDLQELHRLAPFDFGVDVDCRVQIVDLRIQANDRLQPAVAADLDLRRHGHSVWTSLDCVRFARVQLFARLEVVDFNVPGLPVERLVIKDDELIGLGSLGQHLTFSFRVEE